MEIPILTIYVHKKVEEGKREEYGAAPGSLVFYLVSIIFTKKKQGNIFFYHLLLSSAIPQSFLLYPSMFCSRLTTLKRGGYGEQWGKLGPTNLLTN